MMVGSVIYPTGMVGFYGGLRTGVLTGGCWWPHLHILESILNPPGDAGWSLIGCGCHEDPISDQITTPCQVLRMAGIKSQLLCGLG